MAKNNTQKVSINTAVLLCGGPRESDFMDCIIHGKSKDVDFKVKLKDLTRVNLSLKITKVARDKMSEGVFSFTGISDHVNGELSGSYDTVTHEGWLVRRFDNRLN
jgi:hypothetical protein